MRYHPRSHWPIQPVGGGGGGGGGDAVRFWPIALIQTVRHARSIPIVIYALARSQTASKLHVIAWPRPFPRKIQTGRNALILLCCGKRCIQYMYMYMYIQYLYMYIQYLYMYIQYLYMYIQLHIHVYLRILPVRITYMQHILNEHSTLAMHHTCTMTKAMCFTIFIIIWHPSHCIGGNVSWCNIMSKTTPIFE